MDDGSQSNIGIAVDGNAGVDGEIDVHRISRGESPVSISGESGGVRSGEGAETFSHGAVSRVSPVGFSFILVLDFDFFAVVLSADINGESDRLGESDADSRDADFESSPGFGDRAFDLVESVFNYELGEIEVPASGFGDLGGLRDGKRAIGIN